MELEKILDKSGSLEKLYLAVIIGSIILLTFSCEKKEENEKPTIIFLQPDSNLIIANDTIISFIVEPYDKDGTIEKVEFIIDNSIVKNITNSPYRFDWNITTEDNIGTKVVKAIAYDNNGGKGEVEMQLVIKSYLAKWIGNYTGNSDHWISSPNFVNEQWILTTRHSYKKVVVNVSKSNRDSCLDFRITYNDSIVDNEEGLKFSVVGIHSSQWGGGSSHGSLKIAFEPDSLHYRYFQNCGMVCLDGIEFVAKKED